MGWEIAHAESFPLELGRAPKKVRSAWQRTVLPVLRTHPDKSDPPTIKKLVGFDSLWRLRVSDEYRLIYRLEHDTHTAILLLLDHRSKVYNRAGVTEEKTPSSRIIVVAPELLEMKPTEEQVGRAEIDLAADGLDASGEPDRTLLVPIDAACLEVWGVPSSFHEIFLGVATENELMTVSAGVPEEVMERVFNGLWPPSIEEIIQQPVRLATNSDDILSAAEGDRNLESFLLRLDDDQKAFVARFDGPNPKGPWLLKGGPGSGKSTVAMYCMTSLIRQNAAQLPIEGRPTRILFTTYTHSLINAAKHLLESMGIDKSQRVLDIRNIDSLARRDLPGSWQGRQAVSESGIKEYATAVLGECLLDDKKYSFTRTDIVFLIDEIDWVIVGQDSANVDDYLKADRTGRGRKLSEAQRRQIWTFWTRLKAKLETENVCMYSQRLQAAYKSIAPRYDYVFIDEAQDLKPVAIRYCVRLCRSSSRVFVTADSNQSIYGTGLSWSRVADDLSFKGRARILRRNYRTTQEIWQAISEFAADGADRETLDVEAVYSGPYPMICRYGSATSRAMALNEYLLQALLRERLSSSCAAVLCPTYREAVLVVASLSPELNAKAMRSADTDISHPGVKVLTMHAAKGLQFPVVAVVGLQEGQLPTHTPAGMDDDEHQTRQKRLLFVACSRAMRQLAVFAPKQNSSPYVGGLSDEFWETVDAG